MERNCVSRYNAKMWKQKLKNSQNSSHRMGCRIQMQPLSHAILLHFCCNSSVLVVRCVYTAHVRDTEMSMWKKWTENLSPVTCLHVSSAQICSFSAEYRLVVHADDFLHTVWPLFVSCFCRFHPTHPRISILNQTHNQALTALFLSQNTDVSCLHQDSNTRLTECHEQRSRTSHMRCSGRHTDRQTDRHTDRNTGRHTDRHTDRQTDRQTVWLICN